MGKLQKGLFGGFTGKVGNYVGYMSKGQMLIRAVPKRNKKRKCSTAQQHQRAKFAFGQIYLKQLAPLFNITFANYTKYKSASNVAFSHMLNDGIAGVYPRFVMDWPKLLISKGKLHLPVNIVATAETNKINFNWLPEVIDGREDMRPTDRSVLLVICPELQQSIYTASGASRIVGAAAIEVASFAGKEVHTYIAFISEDGKSASNSVYTGMQKLPKAVR
ncbi:MAG: DUF6266 family protein [Chitinophagaceae bacterium]